MIKVQKQLWKDHLQENILKRPTFVDPKNPHEYKTADRLLWLKLNIYYKIRTEQLLFNQIILIGLIITKQFQLV